MYAVKLSETRRTQGLGPALREVLASRDSLEPTIRLLVAPGSLRRLRGHLVTCLPLLAAFLTLVTVFVWERSGSRRSRRRRRCSCRASPTCTIR
jgi:hypothetical protein